MYSGWQDEMPKIKGVEYFDPRIHSKQNAAIQFVSDDINGVKESDLIFCYIERTNELPIGASWECAVAKENNIPIITVWEKEYIDPFFAVNSLYIHTNFTNGIERMKKYIDRVMKCYMS